MRATRLDYGTGSGPVQGGEKSPAAAEAGELARDRASDVTTHWTAILEAGRDDGPRAAAALEQLCRTYWYPLYAYVRSRGHGAEEAKDLTQSFFLHLLENHGLAHANPRKGKFRSFLLAALNHFLTNEWRRGRAAKRGGGERFISIEEQTAESRYSLEPVSGSTPETIYERKWAVALLDRALTRSKAEYAAAGKSHLFDLLQPFLASKPAESDYGTAAEALGLTTGAVGVAVHRLRQRYGELVREEIAHTTAGRAEAADEMRWLFTVVSGD